MTPEFCLIGDVMVDVTMTNPVKMRLGGVVHAARACWALAIPFHLRYISPDYLRAQIETYAKALGAASCEQIAHVNGCPNVIVIREATEAGAQGYEYLLRDEYACEFVEQFEECIPRVSDIVVFPGGYDLSMVLKKIRGRGDIAVDIANWSGSFDDLRDLELSTAICSTSSALFLNKYGGDVARFLEACKPIAKRMLFKENRGGSRIANGEVLTQIGAQLRPIAHSVGVGDVFNVAYLAVRQSSGDQIAGNFASRIAAEYAATTYPDEFKVGAETISKLSDEDLSGVQGVRLPWEARSDLNIYIAAPDFDYNDRSLIDAVAEALRYHNFRPRLPVRENGQAHQGGNRAQKLALFQGDLELLDECEILVAVLMDADPGTLIEIGLAAGMGKPAILFDPLGLANNVMLECAPTEVCSTLDGLVSAVFTELAKMSAHES